MRRTAITIRMAALSAAITLTACSAATQRRTTVESAGDVAASTTTPVTPVNARTLPAGARLVAALDQTLGTKVSRTGDTFTATVADALIAQNGAVVIPAGAKIEGRVTALDDSDNATEPALIRLAFDRIRFDGRSYPFAGAIIESNPVQTTEQSSGDRTRQIVIGGAVGAALGAILGDKDLKHIVIGGALGAAAGSIISLGTEVNAALPAGSRMTVQVTEATALR